MTKQLNLLVFDTHPIQYRSPVFRELVRYLPDFEVAFFDDAFDGSKWWFHEVGKARSENWNLDLKKGFPNRTLNLHTQHLVQRYRTLQQLLTSTCPHYILLYGYYLPEHWMLVQLATQLKIPILFIGETFSSRHWLKKMVFKNFFQRISHFISIGERTQKYYLSLGINAQKIHTAHYCTDNAFFTATQKAHEALRESMRRDFHIPEEGTVLLFVGRLFPRKRPEDIVALHQSLLQNPNVYTIMVGTGELEEKLRAATRGLPRIQLAGFRDQHQIRQIYHGSDFLVVPSEYETWGLVINEAFSCGIPAIVSDTCGAANDLVISNETGFVYPKGDSQSLHQWSSRLINDPTLRAQLSMNAHNKVMKEYDPDSFARAILKCVSISGAESQALSPALNSRLEEASPHEL